MKPLLDHLQKILDLLGPGLWLEIDKAAFSHYFGGDLSREAAEVAAQKLAKVSGCVIQITEHHARIGRAYYKKTAVGVKMME